MLSLNIHKSILLQILKDTYSDTSLGPILGFKGGTAAYLFYNLSRFSVDLDFDLLDSSCENEVFRKVEKILQNYGVVKDSYQKRHTLFFVLAYDEESPNIKVEISRRYPNSHYELKNYLGIPMLVITKEDMFAHKLVAMLERNKVAHRDVYDVWFFLKNNWPINKKAVEQRTNKEFKEYLQECVQFVEKLSERNVLAGIGELLDEKQKVWAKKHLKNDILFLLKLRLTDELSS